MVGGAGVGGGDSSLSKSNLISLTIPENTIRVKIIILLHSKGKSRSVAQHFVDTRFGLRDLI